MKLPLTISLFFFTAFFCLAQKPVSPPSEDPPELAMKREDHLRNMQRAAIPVLQQYLKTLDFLGQQYSREKKYDALIALQSEIKNVQDQLTAANNAIGLNKSGSVGLAIISAKRGDFDAKRVIDVTDILRKILRSAQPTVRLDHDYLHTADPMDGSHNKKMRIAYSINGVRKEKEWTEGTMINFKDDLQ